MKPIILSLLITLLIPAFIIGQNFDAWSEPTPISDSIADNNNPFLLRIEYPMKLMMAWEKSADSSSTAIYMDNIIDEIPGNQILSDPGIKYKHPHLLHLDSYPSSDTLFFLFYETDQNGNSDIYVIAFSDDSTFIDPEPFADSPVDEGQIAVGFSQWEYKNQEYFVRPIAWISDGDLFVRNLLSDGSSYYYGESILIDSNYCSDPSINKQRHLIYTKSDSAGNYICRAECDDMGNWTDPEVLYDATDAMYPTSSLHYDIPCWTAFIDSSWTVMMDYLGSVYNITSVIPLNPAVTGVVWDYGYEEEVYVAITYPDSGVNEIFMNSDPFSFDFWNFSNSGTMNQNPQIFKGESWGFYYHWSNYLVWESYRNGHWQLWYSSIFMGFSDVTERSKNILNLNVYPNPFLDAATIQYELCENSAIEINIFNTNGELVEINSKGHKPAGINSFTWNAHHVPAGIYYIVLRSNDGIFVSKVVKL